MKWPQPSPRPQAAFSTIGETRDAEGNIAYKIAMRFIDYKRKFSGAIGEVIQDYVAHYVQAAWDYDLSPSQKLQIMRNLFTICAKRFYYYFVDSQSSWYG